MRYVYVKGLGLQKKAGWNPLSWLSEGVDAASEAGKTAVEAWTGATAAGFGLSMLGGLALATVIAKMCSPEATADNADKYLVNSTLKSSLAKSIRERDALIAAQNNEQSKILHRDKFLA